MFAKLLPEGIRRTSAAAGIAGGLVMPIPALFWALTSGHSLWYASNLLAGMVLTDVGKA